MKMKVVSKAPTKWYTQNGPIDTKELSQQQLSNIFWYFYFVLNTRMAWAGNAIEKRFSGKFLPYAPTPEFKQEIKILEDKGMITKPVPPDFGKREVPKAKQHKVLQFTGGE